MTRTIKMTSLANTSTEIIPFLQVIVATFGHLHFAKIMIILWYNTEFAIT